MLSPLRRALVRQVRATFNDRSKGEQPVRRSDNALFPYNSVIWRVHGDVTSMLAGGVAALLLQMLHPQALGGVWDHSDVHGDMLGRLRRTARFIAVTTYGERGAAQAAIARVRRIHEQISGTLLDETTYRADDPHLLAWVHVAGAVMFLDGWRRYGEPGMSRCDQDVYFGQSGEIARMLGADPVPQTRAAAEQLIRAFRPELRADDRSRAFRDLILNSPAQTIKEAPVHKLLMSAAVDLLPSWARRMHGLSVPALSTPPIRAATFGLASTLRWAFAHEAYRPGGPRGIEG
jgi:uncharacterized protein (DUF2236 family)